MGILLFIGSGAIAFICVAMSDIDIFKYVPISYGPSGESQFNLNEILIGIGFVLTGIIIFMAMWSCSVTCMTTKWCLIPFCCSMFLVIIFFCIIGLVFTLQGTIVDSNYIVERCAQISSGQFD